MSRLIVASVLAIGLMGEAAASSHSEAPFTRGGNKGRAVESSTIYDQLSAIYHALMGDSAPAAPAAPTVQVRRPGYTPGR